MSEPTIDIPRVACVIPFFQREGGLLARTVRSALRQLGPFRLDVVVVDDGSPRPAVDELAALEPSELRRVTVLTRANGGPGAARNTALDALGEDVRYVAFLDSDDCWRQDHVARAVIALESESADVYVSNWMPLEADTDAYAHFEKLDLAEHEALESVPDVWRHRTDFMLQELTRPIGRLSTMVMRRAPFAALRFDEDLRCAYEDHLFRLQMAEREPRVLFSTRPEVDSGRGVNVFSGAGWGTVQRLDTLADRLRGMRLAQARLHLSPVQASAVAEARRSARKDVVANLLHLARRLQLRGRRSLVRLLKADPLLPFLAPLLAIQALLRSLRG